MLILDHGLPRRGHDLHRIIALPILQLAPVLNSILLVVCARVRVRVRLVAKLLAVILRVVARHVLALSFAHLLIAVLVTSVRSVIPRGGVLALMRLPIIIAVAWSVLRPQIVLVLLRVVDVLGLLHPVVAAALPVHFEANIGP